MVMNDFDNSSVGRLEATGGNKNFPSPKTPWYATARRWINVILGAIALLVSFIAMVSAQSFPYIVLARDGLLIRYHYLILFTLALLVFSIGIKSFRDPGASAGLNIILGALMIVVCLVLSPITYVSLTFVGDYMATGFTIFAGNFPSIVLGLLTIGFSIPVTAWSLKGRESYVSVQTPLQKYSFTLLLVGAGLCVLALGSFFTYLASKPGLDTEKKQEARVRAERVFEAGPTQPAVDGSRAYVGRRYHKEVSAQDLGTGKLEWKRTTSGEVLAPPAIQENSLYVASAGSNAILVLDSKKGNMLKQYQAPGICFSNLAISGNQLFLVISQGNRASLERLNLASGKWSQVLGLEQSGRRSYELVVLGEQLFLHYDYEYGTALYAVSTRFAKVQWIKKAPERVLALPAANQESVFISGIDADRNGYVSALEPDNGKEKWRYVFKTPWGSPTVLLDKVFVYDQDDHVRAIDALAGTEKWVSEPHYGFGRGLAVSNGHIICGSNGNLYALDPVDGTLLWAFPPNEVDSFRLTYFKPVASGDIILTGGKLIEDQKGFLYALDANTGQVRWKVVPGE